MRRTAQIQYLNLGDTQISTVKKINDNFLSLSNLMYGPQGQRGITGPTGPYGYAGPIGPTGNRGIRGTRWFVSDPPPQGGLGDSLVYGDYWVDSSQDTNDIKVFGPSGWVDTGYNLSASSPFKNIYDVIGLSGLTGGVRSTVVSSNPEIATFSFSDTFLTQANANPANSLFNISIDPQKSGAYNLLEFSRGDLNTGTTSSYINNPILRFRDASSSNSNLDMILSGSDFFLKSHAPLPSGIAHNIHLKTLGTLSIYGDSSFSLGARGNSSSGGFSLNSTGSISITANGQFLPSFRNILQDPLIPGSTRRMLINSRIFSTVSTNVFPAVKFENTTQVYGSGGAIPIYFSNFQSLLVQSNGLTISQLLDGGNHIKISTNTSGSNSIERFSISASGRIYAKKRMRKITQILTATSNIDTSNAIAWYLMGTKDVTFTYASGGGARTLAFKADTNEVFIDPSLVGSSYEIGVGLWLCYSATGTSGYTLPEMVGGSFARMFGTNGETFRVKIRSTSTSRKIKHIGITKTTSFAGPILSPSGTNGSFPQTAVPTRYISLTTAASEVELVFKREGSTPAAGSAPSSAASFPWGQTGDKIYWFACGQCGVFTTGT